MSRLETQLMEWRQRAQRAEQQLTQLVASKIWKYTVFLRKIFMFLQMITNRDWWLIQRSRFFDRLWYLEQNPDVAQAGINPAWHYLVYGAFEGRDPSPLFSSRWYLDTYDDVKKASINPLVHYLRYGRREGRSPKAPVPFNHSKLEVPIAGYSQNIQQLSHGKEVAVCTVMSKNYLSFARVFTKSFLKHNPDIKVFALLVDRVEGYFDPAKEPFEMILVEELDNIPNPSHLFFKYNIIELNTAVKPYFFEYLFTKYNIKKLVYFDPDVLILNPIDKILNLLDQHFIVLTPHITEPIEDHLKPNELDILQAGVYNLGFIAMTNTASVLNFLKWWQKRVYDFCRMAPDKGMHVDQKWIDLVPVLFENVYILRDPEYNIAYWNLHSRGEAIRVDGDVITLNGKPVCFFHFSGFDPERIDSVSKHQNRFTLHKLPNLKPLFIYYRDLLIAEGWHKTRWWPYAYDYFDNGVRIPQAARTLYYELGEKALKFGDPFATQGVCTFFAWLNESVEPVENEKSAGPVITRLWYEIYRERPDVQQAYPDLFGVHRRAFCTWIKTSGKKEHKLDEAFFPDSIRKPSWRKQILANFYLLIILPSKRLLRAPLKKLLKNRGKIMMTLGDLSRRIDKWFLDQPQGTSSVPASSFGVSVLKAKPFGVNVAGYLTGEFGVGERARAYVKALQAVGIEYVLNNIVSPWHRNLDRSYREFSENNPYRVNLINVNADQVHEFYRQKGWKYFQGRYNIGTWAWELSSFPEEWLSSFRYLQEIWVESTFCQEAIAKVSPIPVVKITRPIYLEERGIQRNRSQFGLKESSFVFLFIFDFLSVFERKNPLGLVEAFKKAFSNREDVVLVLKCMNSKYYPQELARLKQAIEGLNIRLIDTHLNREEINALLALSDCYVSLHRSEGFGLTIAEAMYLGKPVIATGYSGNMEFMNVNNSFPVKYRLIELEKDYGPYKKGNIWADPDVEHAAELMRLVYEKQGLAAEKGQRASIDIRTYMNPAIAGREILARLLRVAGD